MKEEQGGFAFMMEDAGIQYLVERNCELAQVSNSAWVVLSRDNRKVASIIPQPYKALQS